MGHFLNSTLDCFKIDMDILEIETGDIVISLNSACDIWDPRQGPHCYVLGYRASTDGLPSQYLHMMTQTPVAYSIGTPRIYICMTPRSYLL